MPGFDMAAWRQQLAGARADIEAMIRATHANPILVRLGWHDSGSYSKDVTEPWPKPAGATASIRFKPELSHGCNAGLQNALALIEPIKAKYPLVSYADLYQMASGVAIELAGGPHIPLRFGRLDAPSCDDCSPDGRLPGGAAPFGDGSKNAAEHLRRVFGRLGLTDQEMVVLSGAHTLGRCRPDRSGFGKAETKYTKEGPAFPGGKPGGSPWTPDWLTFDNSYFKEVKAKRDADLVVLETDAALFADEGFRPWAEKYAADQDAFFKDYVAAHLKLSELGAKFQEGTAITL